MSGMPVSAVLQVLRCYTLVFAMFLRCYTCNTHLLQGVTVLRGVTRVLRTKAKQFPRCNTCNTCNTEIKTAGKLPSGPLAGTVREKLLRVDHVATPRTHARKPLDRGCLSFLIRRDGTALHQLARHAGRIEPLAHLFPNICGNT